MRTAQAERIKDHVAGLIHERSVAVDLAFYESPEFYDRLHRARDESGDRSIALLESLGGVTQTSITLVAMVGVLLPLGPWVALALVASTLPAVHVVAPTRCASIAGGSSTRRSSAEPGTSTGCSPGPRPRPSFASSGSAIAFARTTGASAIICARSDWRSLAIAAWPKAAPPRSPSSSAAAPRCG